MRAAFRVEYWKMTRSRVTLVTTVLMGVLLPAMGLAFYSVAQSDGIGALADKAAALLIGEGWGGYLGSVGQIAAVAIFLGAGVVVAWAFGREHVDRTFPSLFALPVPRATVAIAKFVVLAMWLVALAILVGIVALALGLLTNVGPTEWTVIVPELTRLLGITLGAGFLSLTMGYVASVGRGYLPAVAAMIVIIAVAQVAVLFGTGGWFPFAVPGLLAVAGAEGAPELNVAEIGLMFVVALGGVWATVWAWRKAEVV